MKILAKLKLMLWALKSLGKVNKVKALWEKASGYKSVFGLLGIVGYFTAKQLGVEPPDMILEASYGLLGVGLVHKLDKFTGVVSKVLLVVGEVLKLVEKKKDENKDGENK